MSNVGAMPSVMSKSTVGTRGNRGIVSRQRGRAGERLPEARLLVPTPDGTLPFRRYPENVGDQHVAAGIEQRKGLGERRLERNEQQALAEQNQIVAPLGLQSLERRLDKGAPHP